MNTEDDRKPAAAAAEEEDDSDVEIEGKIYPHLIRLIVDSFTSHIILCTVDISLFITCVKFITRGFMRVYYL